MHRRTRPPLQPHSWALLGAGAAERRRHGRTPFPLPRCRRALSAPLGWCTGSGSTAGLL